MSKVRLEEFHMMPGEYGWTAKLPTGSPRLFGREISLEIHTRTSPGESSTTPPITVSQAALVRSVVPALSLVVERVATELRLYNEKFDPKFEELICEPQVWLSAENDDGVAWTFVVERTDNPDFGYHAEFRGTEFIELWAGD